MTDRRGTGGRPLEDVVRMALEGGVRAVQLREKDLATRDLLDLAGRIKSLTDRFGAALYINGRIDVCMAVGAAGVHLRSDHLPVQEVRRILGRERAIGVSCHSLGELVESEKTGADFAVFGPVFDTPSKRLYGDPVGIDRLAQAKAVVGFPVLAIGGITADRVEAVFRAGADGVAVVSAVLAAVDVKSAARDMISALAGKGLRGLAIDRIESR